MTDTNPGVYKCGDCLKFRSMVQAKEPIDMADKLSKGQTNLSSRPDVPLKAGQFHCPILDDVVTAKTPMCHRFAHKDAEVRAQTTRHRAVDDEPKEE